MGKLDYNSGRLQSYCEHLTGSRLFFRSLFCCYICIIIGRTIFRCFISTYRAVCIVFPYSTFSIGLQFFLLPIWLLLPSLINNLPPFALLQVAYFVDQEDMSPSTYTLSFRVFSRRLGLNIVHVFCTVCTHTHTVWDLQLKRFLPPPLSLSQTPCDDRPAPRRCCSCSGS